MTTKKDNGWSEIFAVPVVMVYFFLLAMLMGLLVKAGQLFFDLLW